MTTVHSSEKEDGNFPFLPTPISPFFLIVFLHYMEGLFTNIASCFEQPVFISFRSKACQALINTFLPAIITYHIFIAQLIVFH